MTKDEYLYYRNILDAIEEEPRPIFPPVIKKALGQFCLTLGRFYADGNTAEQQEIEGLCYTVDNLLRHSPVCEDYSAFKYPGSRVDD